jgi:hypothetical protein
VYASAFKDTPRAAAVPIVLELDASDFAFIQRDGTYNDRVDVAYAAASPTGKVYSARRTVALALKPDTYARVKADGLRVIMQANLPPGRYQLHVAAGDEGGKAGSVLYNLDVPDFSKAPLSLSGIALTSQMAAQAISRLAASTDWLKDLVPEPITALRDFPAGDNLTVFGEVYEGAPSAPHLIDVRTELRNDANQVVRTVAFQVSSSQLDPKSGGYGFLARLSLNGVKPGRYVIHVQTQSRIVQQPTASRNIEINVVS